MTVGFEKYRENETGTNGKCLTSVFHFVIKYCFHVETSYSYLRLKIISQNTYCEVNIYMENILSIPNFLAYMLAN